MNFSNEIEKINAIRITSDEFNSYEIPRNVRKSIAIYNKAVINLKLKRVNLAIADLKRSLSLNSDFCEAIKLLGLCYVQEKKFKKAEKTFKKLAKYDIYTQVANEYLEELKAEKTVSKALNTIKDANSNLNDKNKARVTNGFTKKFIISFVVLIIIIAISGLVYWNRSNIQAVFNKSKNIDVNKKEEIEQEQVVNKEYNEINEKYNKIEEENKKLKKDLKSTKLQLDNYKNKNNINLRISNAEKSYAEGNYEKTVNDLISLKSLKLDDTQRARVDNLWNNIKNNVWNIYNEANKLYKQGKYQEALPKLIVVEKIDPELDVMPWALYQIGNCYKEANDNKNALVYFQRVKKNYPNTKYAGYAESTISQMK